jgi:mono/diheme cytochrome c family protein
MQIKIVIGTIAFMLTMIIMGFAALREPARLAEFTAASEGRSIETGATLFQNNCATCHGVDGRAEQCFDVAGNQIGCQGLPLNYAPLLCGDRSERMIALGWEGTKRNFIDQTVSAGRVGTAMPTWSGEFGGPMRDDQVQDVVNFVLNWESDELCSTPAVTFEWPGSVEEFLAMEDIQEGDAGRGQELYVTYGCSGCHGNIDEPGSNAVGPWLGDIATVGETRVEGQSAAQYVYESILNPDAFIAPDCPNGPCAGPPSAMPHNFGERMAANPQDMADLLGLILGQEGQ